MQIIGTHGYFLTEDEKEQQIMRPYPTLGLLYISAYLKKHAKNITILDSTFLCLSEWKEQVIQQQPDLLAFYTNLMTKVQIIQMVEWCKQELPSCHLVVGGPDVTYNLSNYLAAGFDFVVIGEGEQSLLELIEGLEQNRDLTSIAGLAFMQDGSLHIGSERIKIKELASLPFPDRAAIPLEKYLNTWKQFHGKRTLNISTQRGCPYTCKWCSTAVYGQSYRRNSPQKVVEEILHLQQAFEVEALWFVDDVFTVSHKWIAELHSEFKIHNLKIPFECITRAERLNTEILILLKEMGCFRIWIGAESGSQKIIDKMDRRVDLATVQQMIQETKKLGMETGTFIMVGYPDEDFDDIVSTMEHIRKCNPDLLTITKAYPIKGTELYKEVESSLISQLDWNTSTDRELKIPLPYSDLFYDYAIRYLVNGWQAKNNNSLKSKIKSRMAYLMMKQNKKMV